MEQSNAVALDAPSKQLAVNYIACAVHAYMNVHVPTAACSSHSLRLQKHGLAKQYVDCTRKDAALNSIMGRARTTHVLSSP